MGQAGFTGYRDDLARRVDRGGGRELWIEAAELGGVDCSGDCTDLGQADAAKLKAARATSSGTELISNKMVPGLTVATQ